MQRPPKRRCYAEHLGGCDSLSGEHVVSRGLFGDGPVLTRGLRIPPGVQLGIDSLVANILCRKHNSQLSDLDTEIQRVGDACLAYIKAPRSASANVNGVLIERWLLKVAAGSGASGWLRGVKVPPHPDVVEGIFGLRPLPPTVAMYGLANIGRETPQAEAVSVEPMIDDTGIAFLVTIHGLPMLLSVCVDDIELKLRARGTVSGFDVSAVSVLRHPPELRISNRDESAKLVIGFDWS